MKLTESLSNFLNARATPTDQDLIARWSVDMETQGNMIPGEPVAGKRSTWSNGTDTWFNFRIGATFQDYNIPFPLDTYCEGIGCTGWNWRNKVSQWLGFDFDSLTHNKGLPPEDLEKVKQAASTLPYVEVRRSTGGGGLHLYVYLNDIPTDNHTEHVTLAHAILKMMSDECNFPFADSLDVCGSVMWIWHKKMKGTNGLEIIKQATKVLTLEDLPADWRDTVPIRKVSKTNDRTPVALNDKHKKQVDDLRASAYTTIWVSELNLLQTHTVALQELEHVGYFKTNSVGRNPGTPNCFMYPLKTGWKVYRFSPGAKEDPTWEHGEWTGCNYDCRPTLRVASLANHGIEDVAGYTFNNSSDAVAAVAMLGETLDVPLDRPVNLKTLPNSRLLVSIPKTKKDEPIDGWLDKKSKFVRIIGTKNEVESKDEIRYLRSMAGKPIGFVVAVGNKWEFDSATNLKMVLQKRGSLKTEAEEALGAAVEDRWTHVCIPFGDEFPGDRQWNINAPQHIYKPADEDEPHPTWDALFANWGRSLDEAVLKNAWCQAAGIKTGAEYLFLFYVVMLRFPELKLPILFMWGQHDSGKSSYFEAFQLLVKGGLANAKRCLAKGCEFNYELANCVLAYVDEQDLSQDKTATEKMKEMSTQIMLSIRRMHSDQYEVTSYLHLVHIANSLSYHRIEVGDVRTTVAAVTRPEHPIDKDVLQARLKDEARYFMRTIFNTTLPPPAGRLAVAVLENADKQEYQFDGDPVALFIHQRCEYGKFRVAKPLLYRSYQAWCDLPGSPAKEQLSIEAFGRKVKELGGGSVTKGKTKGTRENAYVGIRLKRTPGYIDVSAYLADCEWTNAIPDVPWLDFENEDPDDYNEAEDNLDGLQFCDSFHPGESTHEQAR